MNKTHKVALFGALALVACGVSYVWGQGNGVVIGADYQSSPTELALSKAGVNLRDGGDYTDALRLGQAYLEAPNDVPAVREVIRSAQVNKSTGAAMVDLLSLTAAQNQKIIEQNERIIKQLEAGKK